MADLAAFLAARLDEDEAAARENIAMGWDRPRALREVAAKRAILAQYQGAVEGALEWGVTSTLEEAVQHLAAVYSDHPDYDPAWA